MIIHSDSWNVSTEGKRGGTTVVFFKYGVSGLFVFNNLG